MSDLKKSLLLFSTFIFAYFLITQSIRFSESQSVKGQENQDALEALNFWAKARAYPDDKFPREGFAKEFMKAKFLKSVNDTTQWEAIGPKNFGGRTISLAVNPQNANTIYAGSASGGLWRSFSAGEGASAWSYIPTGFPVLGVSSIAISPADTNVMFIGTGEVYAYQNSTGGIVDRLTRGSYGIGILKTTDGGHRWTKSLDWSMNQERGVWAVRFNPENFNTIFAATTEGVYVSYDAGESWEQKSSVPMATDLIINPADTNKILLACGNFASPHYGIYRSTDGGNYWTKISSGLPAVYQGKALFSMYEGNPDIVFASIGGGLSGTWLCKSDDFGETWQTVSTFDYAKYQGWYSHIVIVNQNNPDKLLTAGVDIYKSTNGGVNLTQKSYWSEWYFGRTIAGEEEGPPDYSHADNHCFAYSPDNPNVVYFGTDGGVFKTTDFGETFHGRNGGYQTQQFYNGFSSVAHNGYLSIGGLQDNASAIYDGQTNWIRTLFADGCWTAINRDNPNTLYGSYYYLNIYRSNNGGNNWNNLYIPDAGNTAFVSPFIISPANQSVMYAAGSKILRSSNGGNSWTVKSSPTSNPAISMAGSWQNSDLIYVGFAPENGTLKIIRSDDGGITFTDISGGLPNRYPMDIAVNPTDDNNVYIVFSGFGSSHVFASFNGGNNWEDISGDLPDVPTNAVTVDPNNPQCVYVGNDLGVFFTSDNGATWRRLSAELPDAALVMDLSIVYGGSKIIAATYGNGAFMTDLISPNSVEDENKPPTGFVLYQNYPNPFSAKGGSTTNITYVIASGAKQSQQLSANNEIASSQDPRNDNIRLTVYDALGRKVATLVNKKQAPGNYTVQFDASKLSSGIYFYTLRAGEFTATKKMILMK